MKPVECRRNAHNSNFITLYTEKQSNAAQHPPARLIYMTGSVSRVGCRPLSGRGPRQDAASPGQLPRKIPVPMRADAHLIRLPLDLIGILHHPDIALAQNRPRPVLQSDVARRVATLPGGRDQHWLAV